MTGPPRTTKSSLYASLADGLHRFGTVLSSLGSTRNTRPQPQAPGSPEVIEDAHHYFVFPDPLRCDSRGFPLVDQENVTAIITAIMADMQEAADEWHWVMARASDLESLASSVSSWFMDNDGFGTLDDFL